MYVFVYVFVSTKIGHEYSAFFDIIPRPRPFKMGIFDMNTAQWGEPLIKSNGPYFPNLFDYKASKYYFK